MFDLGFPELLIIGTVALIVVGPKDLPKLFQTVGQFVGKAKGMAREFTGAMNAAANESGLNEINQTIKAASNPTKFGAAKIREASGMEKPVDGAKDISETGKLKSKLSDERAANAEKINLAMAKAAEDRVAVERVKTAADGAVKAAPTKAAKAKAAPKKAGVKKATPRKAPPKKAAPKRTTSKAKTPAKDAK